MSVVEEPQVEQPVAGEPPATAHRSCMVLPPAPAATRFAVARDPTDLEGWSAGWAALDGHAPSPMETFDWIHAAASTWGADGDLEIIISHRDGQVLGAAPLVRLAGWPGGRWQALNYHRVFEPADLVYRDDAALADLLAELLRRGRPLFLERVFANSPTAAYLQGPLARRALAIARPQAHTPWIALDETWSEPEQRLSSRRRSDFRRSARAAQQLGQVSAECYTPTIENVDRLLDLAFEVERRSWKGEAGTALAVDPSGEFYRRYARRAAQDAKLRINILRIGQEVAAMQLGVVHRERYWVLKVGYDQRFQRASPGILLMVEAIKQAQAAGLVAYELLGTVEPWIQVWTELEHACVSLRVYPASLRGAASLATDLATKSFSRLRARRRCET
jgi:CelD/BcsL family acetyltransferase involved in cellulose biosynthesis